MGSRGDSVPAGGLAPHRQTETPVIFKYLSFTHHLEEWFPAVQTNIGNQDYPVCVNKIRRETLWLQDLALSPASVMSFLTAHFSLRPTLLPKCQFDQVIRSLRKLSSVEVKPSVAPHCLRKEGKNPLDWHSRLPGSASNPPSLRVTVCVSPVAHFSSTQGHACCSCAVEPAGI